MNHRRCSLDTHEDDSSYNSGSGLLSLGRLLTSGWPAHHREVRGTAREPKKLLSKIERIMKQHTDFHIIVSGVATS